MKKDNTSKNFRFSEKLDKLNLSFDRIFAALISSFMLAYIFQMMTNNKFFELQSYYDSISFASFWLITVFGTIMLCATTYLVRCKPLIPYILISTAAVLTCQLASSYTDAYGGALYEGTPNEKPIDGDAFFMIGLAVVNLIIILWVTKDDKLELKKLKITHTTCLITAGLLFIATTIFFGYVTSLEYKTFTNHTFDFGIFAQMFENMATTGAPVTTVERSMEMSHFGVHFSPIYYLLLPGYYIFRSPIYLHYAQAACVAAGVFAVYLICKKLGLSGKITLCFEIIYCFYPCLFNGCFCDFHENKMLTALILYLFYFIISNKRIPIIIFTLLTLMVKEDAAIYIIVIALYVLLSRKEYLNGAIMMLMAVVYFVTANRIIASVGTEGVMMSRLNDYFLNEEQTYFSVFKSIIYDIGYIIKMMFTSDKLPFVIWMFLPVAFSPFMTKKLTTLVLLLPIIPINLMQTWQYQYNIDFQYSYGIAVLIIFSAIICIKDLKRRPRHIALLLSMVMCVAMTSNLVAPKIALNQNLMQSDPTNYEMIQQKLDTIPSNASVTADNSIVPHLYFVKQLYTVPEWYPQNKEIDKTDYYIIDTRSTDNVKTMINDMDDDYELVDSVSFVEIYKHK